ncbi:RDD family protein [Sediminicurvatus halobius]|uniref:RDD family protein n=1 Tax=Sediminicurvatus halobius TaxID=2182432 RepID=A0A2U2MWF4_9GAMM|nr:RDD family protein [Spiribacter halobius]PWG61190.1 hypothetical protein DEM34_17780 [Spiribacter halobius]UEX77635.1 RDD family protein [Spiribacter halobius]
MWHFSRDGVSREGPLELEELARRLVGEPDLDSIRVWRPGLEGWVRASEVEEITQAIEPLRTPPPLPGEESSSVADGTAHVATPTEDAVAASSTAGVSHGEGAVADAAAPEEADASTRWEVEPPHPWRRFFARILDLALFGVAVTWLVALTGVGAGAVLSLSMAMEGSEAAVNFVISAILIAAWVPIEALILAGTANTPGRWLMGLRVVRSPVRLHAPEGLDAETALKRSALVWIYGMGAGLPLIQQLLMILHLMGVYRGEPRFWDESAGTVVIARPRNGFQNMGYGLAVALVFVTIAGLNQLAMLPLERQFAAVYTESGSLGDTNQSAADPAPEVSPAVPGATPVFAVNRCEEALEFVVQFRTGEERFLAGWYQIEPNDRYSIVESEGLPVAHVYLSYTDGAVWPAAAEADTITRRVVNDAFEYIDDESPGDEGFRIRLGRVELERAGDRYQLPLPCSP